MPCIDPLDDSIAGLPKRHMDCCPLGEIIRKDFYQAVVEADHESHRDDIELLLDYAEEVLSALKDHQQTHVVSEEATQ